jgi:hypothetical protein
MGSRRDRRVYMKVSSPWTWSQLVALPRMKNIALE